MFSSLLGLPRMIICSEFLPASGVSASLETENLALTGVVFQPFEELKKEGFDIPVTPQVSLARQKYTDDCEAAINEQINVEYIVSYVYHSLYAYFGRDNIALKGLAKLSRNLMKEKREHAEKLTEYQNIRGGRVKLQSILMPLSEFEHAEKGDALYEAIKKISEYVAQLRLVGKGQGVWHFDQMLLHAGGAA